MMRSRLVGLLVLAGSAAFGAGPVLAQSNPSPPEAIASETAVSPPRVSAATARAQGASNAPMTRSDSGSGTPEIVPLPTPEDNGVNNPPAASGLKAASSSKR